MVSKATIGYAGILLAGLGLAAALSAYWLQQYGSVRDHYVANSTERTRFVGVNVQKSFAAIYDNIRTLSFLPSIRSIDRHGENLSEEALITIQQIYNDLADNVSVSEVYVLPVDFDPERLDSVTNNFESPILAFDQLIVGTRAAAAPADGPERLVVAPATPEDSAVADDKGFKQDEIFEYRALRKQLDWLQANYPTVDKVDGLRVPMLGSEEVITCDNSEFDGTRNDADRKGLIQIVPYYGLDGKLRGGVAAIMRSNAYHALLPATDYALVNTTYGFATRPVSDGQDKLSADWVQKGQADPTLIYSQAVRIPTADANSQWLLWAGHPDAAFSASAEATNVRSSAIASLIAVALLVLGAGFVCFLIDRNMRARLAANAGLEQRVGDRTAEIQRLAAEAAVAAEANVDRVAQTTLLNDRIAEVLEAALAGDFSRRLSVSFADPTLQALATSINDLVQMIDRGIAETATVLSAMASTDLTLRVTGSYSGALARLKDDTNSVADRLSEVVSQLRGASSALRTAAGDILSGTNDLSNRTTSQAARVEETSAAVERLDGATADIAKRAIAASATAKAVADTATTTGGIMDEANEAMMRISESSSKIANIIGLIDDVAFQTNLLALNASVEAARAGDAGKGFAVVAVEVRRLAQSAAAASAQVKTLVDQSTNEVSVGERLVAKATESLSQMLDGIRENSSLIGGIATATREQSETISEISGVVRQIDEMTQHNAALVEETNAAIEQTERQTNELDTLVDVFILAEGSEEATPHAAAVRQTGPGRPAPSRRRAA